MSDERATLYIDYKGEVFRVKVFENMVGIERQYPHGDNILLSFDDVEHPEARAVLRYDRVWDHFALTQLLERYPFPPRDDLVCDVCGHDLLEDGTCTNSGCIRAV